MDHCFYIAPKGSLRGKTDRKARLQESFARRFLGTAACPERICLGERSKVPGENVFLAYISDITLKRGLLYYHLKNGVAQPYCVKTSKSIILDKISGSECKLIW